ncbi:MAG: primosomal protein N' [Lentisphaeria bacterium]
MPAIAKVVINLSLDREFDYLIPPELNGLIRVGSRVSVPFGKGNSTRTGYVVSLAGSSAHPKLKQIASLADETERIPDNLIKLAEWIAKYYCCAKEQAVRSVLPGVVRSGKIKRKKQKHVTLVSEDKMAEVYPQLEHRAKKQAAVLRALTRRGNSGPLARILKEAEATHATARTLEKKELIRIEEKVVERDPFEDDVILPTEPLDLTDEQKVALQKIQANMNSESPGVVLLYGVTGSGKTEVYLQAIADCLEQGKEAIVLVPEISLTPQTTERFRSRFGSTVSVLHSGLSDGERFDEWMKIQEGRTKIAVGARSALFAPFKKLGLIVVDEEHENTYKQEEAPRYNARDVAVVRGKMENSTVVLGSATPSVESYNNATNGKYAMASLFKRVDDRAMPPMEVADMRAEAAMRGGPRIFSRRLESLIRDRLDKGEQTIIFLNRRGYASQMMCTKCGYVATCEDCSIAYTYHRHSNLLMCHLCGRMKEAYRECPQCRDKEIRYTGLGTEKVEAIARKLFPKAVIARMDSDTMTAKNAYKKTLNAVRTGRVHILIGTQMIAKGLDFPNVTLVGIVFADLGLHIPDFRAGERTFQLLTQVSGRAGRGHTPGYVIVQSYTPFHPALQYAVEKNYKGFVTEELETRKVLSFPPQTHAVLVHFRGDHDIQTSEVAQAFADSLQGYLPEDAEIAGPMPSPLARIRSKYRYQMMIRTRHVVKLSRALRQFLLRGKPHKDIDIYADVDPVSLL